MCCVAVPAAEVITKIADIIAKDEYPLPFPHHQIRQKVKVDLAAYNVKVTRGGILVCTVQMFLLHTGLYIVEFTRGQVLGACVCMSVCCLFTFSFFFA